MPIIILVNIPVTRKARDISDVLLSSPETCIGEDISQAKPVIKLDQKVPINMAM